MIMLRTAESLFWIGRYMERIESHARLIDVHYHMRHELMSTGQGTQGMWERLAAIVGEEPSSIPIHNESYEHSVIHYLTFERKNRNSVMSCLQQARENIRSLRDRIPDELWDVVNCFYLWLKDQDLHKLLQQTPHTFYQRVREGTALFQGMSESAMLWGYEWHFIQAGKQVERMETIVRLLQFLYKDGANHDILPHQADGYERIAVLLHAAGAYEPFRRFHADDLSFENVVQFLLFNPEFPRSVSYAYSRLADALTAIQHSGPGGEEAAVQALLHAGRIYTHLSRWSQEDIGYSPVNLCGDMREAIHSLAASIAGGFFEETAAVI